MGGGNVGRVNQEKGVDIVEKMEKRSKGKRGKRKDAGKRGGESTDISSKKSTYLSSGKYISIIALSCWGRIGSRGFISLSAHISGIVDIANG
jgi:hypothetical protein